MTVRRSSCSPARSRTGLWRDIVAALEDRYGCITIDLWLGAHPWPLATGADRSATSVACLLLDCLELLDVHDSTVIANDTAGGLLLLSLATGHPALGRVGRSRPDELQEPRQIPTGCPQEGDGARSHTPATRPSTAPAPASIVDRRSSGARSSPWSPRADSIASATSHSSGRHKRDTRVARDLVAAMAGFRPQLLIDAAEAIPRFDRPTLLIWDDSCDFFPITDAQRLASEFPQRHARLGSRRKDVAPD